MLHVFWWTRSSYLSSVTYNQWHMLLIILVLFFTFFLKVPRPAPLCLILHSHCAPVNYSTHSRWFHSIIAFYSLSARVRWGWDGLNYMLSDPQCLIFITTTVNQSKSVIRWTAAAVWCYDPWSNPVSLDHPHPLGPSSLQVFLQWVQILHPGCRRPGVLLLEASRGSNGPSACRVWGDEDAV